jgi:hypothetical protein
METSPACTFNPADWRDDKRITYPVHQSRFKKHAAVTVDYEILRVACCIRVATIARREIAARGSTWAN